MKQKASRKFILHTCEPREATAESHTTVWIKDLVLEACSDSASILSKFRCSVIQQVIDAVGRSHICAIVSDSTGNTQLH